MRLLNSESYYQAFVRQFSRSLDRVTIFDYDGTLAPFTVERDRAYPYRDVKEILDHPAFRNSTRLVIVSGRAIEDLKPLLGLDPLPEIWGSHGGECLLPNGEYWQAELDLAQKKAFDSARQWMTKMGWRDDIERKPLSLALHWRGRPPGEAASMARLAGDTLSGFVGGASLEIHAFDGGLEMRPLGIHKGEAVTRILGQGPTEVNGVIPVVYFGDDLTDEDAFAVLKGRGLGVLVRTDYRETAADLWVEPPEELCRFIRELHHCEWMEGIESNE